MIPIMTTEEFNKILGDTIASITETLTVKMAEYIRYDNVMHNFDKAMKISGQTREQVIASYALKHMVSISDIREDISNGKEPSRELVEEKYGDAINYLILEKASILSLLPVEVSHLFCDSPYINTTKFLIGHDSDTENNIYTYTLIKKTNNVTKVILSNQVDRLEDLDKQIHQLKKIFNAEIV